MQQRVGKVSILLSGALGGFPVAIGLVPGHALFSVIDVAMSLLGLWTPGWSGARLIAGSHTATGSKGETLYEYGRGHGAPGP